MVCEVAERHKANLTLSSSSTTNRPGCNMPCAGGGAGPHHFVYFAAAMASKQSGRAAPQAI